MSNLKIKNEDGTAAFKHIAGSGDQTDGDPFVPQVELVDSNGYAAEVDGVSNALMSVDFAHHEVHEGDTYSTSTYTADLDVDGELSIAFTTPDTAKWFHLVPMTNNSSSSVAEMLEAPTITVDTGSSKTIINSNRNSANTSGALSIETSPTANTATINPTITADGTVIAQAHIGSGKEKGISEDRGVSEFILKQNTTYAFRITGLANDGEANIKLIWYEHTSSN